MRSAGPGGKSRFADYCTLASVSLERGRRGQEESRAQRRERERGRASKQMRRRSKVGPPQRSSHTLKRNSCVGVSSVRWGQGKRVWCWRKRNEDSESNAPKCMAAVLLATRYSFLSSGKLSWLPFSFFSLLSTSLFSSFLFFSLAAAWLGPCFCLSPFLWLCGLSDELCARLTRASSNEAGVTANERAFRYFAGCISGERPVKSEW